MWSRFRYLLFGTLLLASGGYLISRAVFGWKPFWRQQRTATVQHIAAVSPPSSDRDGTQVYGVLAQSTPGLTPVSDITVTPSASVPPAAVDHVVPAPAAAPKHFLHKRFPVKDYEGFEFVVPARAISPRLHGTFNSFVKSSEGEIVSDETANVGVLLLKEQEFDDFVHHRGGTATFSADDSSGQTLDWVLSSPMSGPQRYYLVFHNSSAKPQNKFVDADFTVSFD